MAGGSTGDVLPVVKIREMQGDVLPVPGLVPSHLNKSFFELRCSFKHSFMLPQHVSSPSFFGVVSLLDSPCTQANKSTTAQIGKPT